MAPQASVSAVLALLFTLAAVVAAASPPGTPPAASAAQRAADRLTQLPGQPAVTFPQYTGYVTVNSTHGRALFYWYVESTSGANEKPLLLWLTGGPGCSALYAATQEVGPFIIQNGKPELRRNPEAWNQDANLLFLESPVGVGFSYTNTSSDLQQIGDTIVVEDMFIFLVEWLNRFPELKDREFYIAGTGYTGHLGLQLADKILETIKKGGGPRINVTGIMVGSPTLDDPLETRGTVDYAWSHGIISDEVYQNLTTVCGDFNDGTGQSTMSMDRKNNSCNVLYQNFLDSFGQISEMSIYSPFCAHRSSQEEIARRGGLQYVGLDACAYNYTEEYFNRLDVQSALHSTGPKNGPAWKLCSHHIFTHWHESPVTVLPLLKKLIDDASLRIWLFGGDADGIIPIASTRYALQKLNLKTVQPWKRWYVGDQVAGFTVEYKGLRYVTIRGAGLAAPVTEPAPSHLLFTHFLADRELPAEPMT